MLEQPNLCNTDDAPAPLLAAAVCISLAVLTSSPLYQPIAVDKGGSHPTPGSVWAESDYGHRISDAIFMTVFHTNYGSILLRFRDMTTGQTTDDVQTDQRQQPLPIRPLKRASNNTPKQ